MLWHGSGLGSSHCYGRIQPKWPFGSRQTTRSPPQCMSAHNKQPHDPIHLGSHSTESFPACMLRQGQCLLIGVKNESGGGWYPLQDWTCQSWSGSLPYSPGIWQKCQSGTMWWWWLLSRQVASTADHPNKDGPCCLGQWPTRQAKGRCKVTHMASPVVRAHQRDQMISSWGWASRNLP